MKIGSFAKRFRLPVGTVRYYVNNGLLLPNRHNTQYHFDDSCMRDMEHILRFKSFGFSISEIQRALSTMRLSNLTAVDDVADLLQLLDQKRTALLGKDAQLQQDILSLQQFIDEIRTEQGSLEVQAPLTGVPLEMLPLICCPDCQKQLSLHDAVIQNGQVMNAALFCSCGYKADIQNGILITRGGYISELDTPDTDRKFYKDLPASWVSMFQRSFNWMWSQFETMDQHGKVILENHINCYSFLFSRLDELATDAYYIFTDKYPEIVAQFKRLIGQQKRKLKILYMADSTFRYPLKKGCVDLYIDYHSLNEYAIFNHEQDLFRLMLPLLHPKSSVLGTYFYFAPKSRSRRKLVREYPQCVPDNFSLAHLKSAAGGCGLICQQEVEIGMLTEGGGKNRNFTYHVNGDPLHLHGYWYEYV